MSEHRHTFTSAIVVDGLGQRRLGHRCYCGMETIGGVNAALIRVGQHFNRAIGEALDALARASRQRPP